MPGAAVKVALERIRISLFRLFEEANQDQGINLNLNQLHKYYSNLIEEAPCSTEEYEILTEYSDFITLLGKVKTGNLSAKEAVAEVEEINCDRNCIDLCISLIQACEAIFWGTVACLAYAGALAVGIPLILCEPLIGMAVTFSSAFIAICATEFFFETLEDIDSMANHDSALNNQKYLISNISMFRKSSSPVTDTTLVQTEESEDEQENQEGSEHLAQLT